MFTGISSLRKEERQQLPVSEKSKQLQEYLKAYTGEDETQKKKKKKKVKKKKPGAISQQLRIIDEDVTGFKSTTVVQTAVEEDSDEGDSVFLHQ